MDDETLVASTAECRLTVTATHAASGILQLRYTAYNCSASAVYLCSQLSSLAEDANAAFRPQPNVVHVQVEGANVHVDKSVMDLSFRSDLKALDIPLLLELPAGSTATQLLKLAMPLRPYRVDGQRPTEVAQALLPMWFTLGYFRSTSELLGVLAPASPDLYQLLTVPTGQLHTVTVGPFTELVAVVNPVPNSAPAAPVSPELWTPWS